MSTIVIRTGKYAQLGSLILQTIVVIGALTNSANIDIKLTDKLAARAYPMAVTFHKAIDYTEDILFELNRL